MKRTAPLLTVVLLLFTGQIFAQDFAAGVRKHVREVSVSIEGNEAGRTGKPTLWGSGTLFEHDGEMYCVTAAHVTDGMDHAAIRIAQHCSHDESKSLSVFGRLIREDKESDVAVLQLGSGVFHHKAKWCLSPHKLDAPILHCGSMVGLHHTLTRGYIVGLNRRLPGLKVPFSQADITAYPGSSGGGVFNAKGEYIGMVTRGWTTGIILMVPASEMGLCLCGDNCPKNCKCGCKHRHASKAKAKGCCDCSP